MWGAPRIHGELLKLGIAVAQSTVARYLPRSRKPPSQTWRTFLTNHLAQTAALDFFTVPTATFRVLFVFVVLSHERRRVVHFGVTEHPTEEWTMQQMREAFPWDQAPRYVLRRFHKAVHQLSTLASLQNVLNNCKSFQLSLNALRGNH